MLCLIIFFILCCIIENVSGNADLMLDACSTTLSVGSVIMGSGAFLDTGSASVVVKRNGLVIPSHSHYTPGETLFVSFSDPSMGEYVIDLNKGSFVGSNVGCDGSRFYDDSYSKREMPFILPSSGSGDVSLVAGWASTQSAIHLTNKFTLIEEELAPGQSRAPTVQTTHAPSSQPVFDLAAEQENKNMAITVGVISGSIFLAFIVTVVYQRLNYYGNYDALPK